MVHSTAPVHAGEQHTAKKTELTLFEMKIEFKMRQGRAKKVYTNFNKYHVTMNSMSEIAWFHLF